MNNNLQSIKYDENLSRYINNIENCQYIFEVTKCCNYCEWVSVFKCETTKELYKNVCNSFGGYFPHVLYVRHHLNDNEELQIPHDDTILKDFILNNFYFFRPIYPIQYKIIYKLYFSSINDNNSCHSCK